LRCSTSFFIFLPLDAHETDDARFSISGKQCLPASATLLGG
jgi:hypothetical protein